jgi:hypothetical protein
MSYELIWTAEGPNILAENSLERIKRALSEDWVVGLHMSPFPDKVAFCTYNAFLTCVTDARPGDIFTLWSIAEMRRRGFLLVDNRYRGNELAGDSLLSLDDLERVCGYLTEGNMNEVLAITSVGGRELEIFWTDLDSSDMEPCLDAARRAAVPGGRICVLPFTKIDGPDFHLADAMRPNEKGEVPLKRAIE